MLLPNHPNVDLFAAGINALNGVLVARNPSHDRGYTLMGLLIMSYFGGIGGGVARDMLLNDIPAPIKTPAYLVVCLAMAVLAWPAIEILNIDRPLPIIAAAASILIAVPLPAAWGALQASERFAALGWLQSMASSLKLVFGIGLAAVGFGASAITFGVFAASGIALLVALRVLRPLLREAAVAAGATVRFGAELTGFTQDDEGVDAVVAGRDGGRDGRPLRARYLVAADGARSPVRDPRNPIAISLDHRSLREARIG